MLFVAQRFDDSLCKMLVDFAMTRNGLELAGFVVRIPVMFPAMTDKLAPELV
jgi:hypothetical protein